MKYPIRLVVLSSTFPRWEGDAQPSFVFDLCRRLADEFAVTVLAPHAKGAAELERWGKLDIVRFRYGADSSEQLCYGSGMFSNLRKRPWNIVHFPKFLISQGRALRKLLATGGGPVVVHAHWLLPQGWVAARVLSNSAVPLLVTAHGSDVMKIKGPWFDWLHRQTVSRAQAVAVVGPTVAARVQGELGGAPNRLHLLPMGVDVRFFVPSNDERREDSLLFVGRLVREKGVAVLIAAFALLRKMRPSLRLIIAGDGEDAARLRKLSEHLEIAENVLFTGWCSKEILRALYQEATFCVLPSENEGFGLAAAEALACGCPVLATDLPAFRLMDGGAGAIRFCPGAHNASRLASEMASLLDQPVIRRQMSSVAARRAEEFSAERLAERYAQLIRSLAVPSGV